MWSCVGRGRANYPHSIWAAVVLTGVWLIAAGCAAPTVPDEPVVDDRLAPGVIWDIEAGEPLETDEFIDELEEARWVVVGESHGEPWHHDAQRRIYRQLTERNPGRVAAGLEMIERRFQPVVDDYLAGEIDEAEMLERVEWQRRWGVDADPYYRWAWQQSRDHEQPVVALNAPREVVSRVAEVGVDGLDDQQRDQIAEQLHLDDENYRQRLRDIFGGHHHGQQADEQAFERFVEAQITWDETMAETAFDFIAEHPNIEQMVLLTGRGHMEGGYGIPPRLIRRGAPEEDVITVVPVSIEGPVAEQMQAYRDIEFLRDNQIADYVWIEYETVVCRQ